MATSRWQRLPNESGNSKAGILGDINVFFAGDPLLPTAPGRSMSKKGVGTGIWNSRKQTAFSHLSILQ
jgi:hypothetical protein